MTVKWLQEQMNEILDREDYIPRFVHLRGELAGAWKTSQEGKGLCAQYGIRR